MSSNSLFNRKCFDCLELSEISRGEKKNSVNVEMFELSEILVE